MRRLLFTLFLLFPSVATADDWPKFLGPLGTSVSTEKGIIKPWPKAGLKILWHKELGPGYGMPTISKGKLYHFDRKPRKDGLDENKVVRLTCMDARTGASLWTYEYFSIYKDQFGYNNGP